MSNRREYWDRVGCVKIEGANGRMIEYRGLDFKFNVKYISGSYTDFTVSVLGLSSKTVSDLTVWNPVRNMYSPRKIEVYGGYASTGEELIATGYIWYAVPTRPPDMWMNFECKRFLKFSEYVEKPMVYTGKTVKEVFNLIADECDLRGDYQASGGDVVVDKYEISGKIGELIPKFIKAFNKTADIRTDVIVCADQHGEKERPAKQVKVTQWNGMLAIGNIDYYGATITARLRTDINLFSWINMESALIPAANGPYYVNSIEYKGHFRGEDWQVKFGCFRGEY